MAHFAELDENNVVLRVIVVSNADTADANGVEDESIGVAHCRKLLGGRWVQTSYNGNKRKNYAGIGHTYDPVRDAFIAPQPDPNYIFDEEKCGWILPETVIKGGKEYVWDAATNSYVEVPAAV